MPRYPVILSPSAPATNTLFTRPIPHPPHSGTRAFAAAVATFIAHREAQSKRPQDPVPFGVPPAPD